MAGLILKTEEIRINFFSGAIYTNRPAETCYLHATDVELRKKLEILQSSVFANKKSFKQNESKVKIYLNPMYIWVKIIPHSTNSSGPFLHVVVANLLKSMIAN